jgi:hypothetical protein
MAQDTKRWILLRALAIVGGRDELAIQLRARPIQLDSWLTGFTEPPDEFLLRAVDIVCEERERCFPVDTDSERRP